MASRSARFVSLFAVVAGLFPATALGNGYTGLLHNGGLLSITSNDQAESGGFVYGSDSWSGPAGVQFNGFAYTSATFSSVSDNSVGGVSAGFGADGGSAAQPALLFPWTNDCSITNSGHYWTNSNASKLAGTSGDQTCNTSGNNSGWNYLNAEIENGSPGTDPQTSYHTLWLTVFCQAATCNYDSGREWGTGGASVTDLSGDFIDPSNQPTGNVGWGSAVNPGTWYQTDTAGLVLELSASDPAGVCAMYANLTGPSTLTSGLVGNENPAVTDVGAPIGSEYTYGTSPCWSGGPNIGTWTVPGGLSSGTYSVNLFAANPGNYEGQGFNAGGSPEVATVNNAVEIDDSVPSLSWAEPARLDGLPQTNEQLGGQRRSLRTVLAQLH